MKKLKFLPIIVLALFTAFTLGACGNDDNPIDNPPYEPVVGDSVKFNHTVNGKYLTSIGSTEYVYDVDNNLNYYNGVYSGWLYKVSVNPFEVNHKSNEHDYEARIYNVKFTKDGYISSFIVDETSEYYSTTAKFGVTYTNDCIAKIVNYVSGSEEGLKMEGSIEYKFIWENENLSKIETSGEVSYSNGKKQKVKYDITYTYGSLENKYRQYTPALTTFYDSDWFSPLIYLGYFGKSSKMLPIEANRKDIEIDYIYNGEDEAYISTSNIICSYELNDDGTIACVFEEREYSEAFEDYFDTWVDYETYDFIYDNVQPDYGLHKKTVRMSDKGIKRAGFLNKRK